jgi:RNA polymerase sigma factor (sigma-70 family)
MTLSPNPPRSRGRSPVPGVPEENPVNLTVFSGEPQEPAFEVVLRYVRAIPYRRHLPRALTKRFVRKTWQLLDKVAKTEPGFFEELADHLISRRPRPSSRPRQILAETINSVLEELNVFHSRRDVLAGLPKDWDVADPDNETPEYRLDFEEQVRILREALNTIDPRSARMLQARYWEGLTLSQIGDEFGLAKQRVSEILAAAMPALVAALYAVRAMR